MRSIGFPLRLLLRALLLLALLAIVLPSAALAGITTGAIKGTTVDEGGLPIPGVLLTVKSEALIGGAQQRYSDDSGRFTFFELPPGPYELTAEKAGFSKIVKPNLRIDIGRTVQLTIEMPLVQAGEEIVVEESRPTIDTEQTSKGEVLSRDFLQRMPTGRSYQSAVQAAPGVTGGANPNVAGAGADENTYMLDGVNITDPVTGTFSMNFNFDAIEQLEVLTNALDPEYGEGLGGVINIVTQSGGNRLEFDSRVWVTNGNWSPKMDARYGADGVEIAPTDFDSQWERYEISSKISGPIIRDKAWFILSYEWAHTLRKNVGIDLPRDYDGHYILGKVTVQPNAGHRFTALIHTDPTTIDNTYQSDRYVAPEAQGRQAQGGYIGSLHWDWFISPETILETKLTTQKSYIEVYGVPCTHDKNLGYHPCEPDELENSLDFLTPGRMGSYHAFDSDNWPYYYFDDRYRYNLTSKLSVLQVEAAGLHDLKTGVELDRTIWNQIIGYTGNMYFYDLNEVMYAPSTFKNYYWVETSGPFNVQAVGDHFGWFLQDAWKPIDNLTFRYGVRYDHTQQRDDQGNAAVDAGLWGPRIFTAWDPWGNGKTVIRGGWGRVNDTGRLAVASFSSQANTFGSKLFLGEYFGSYTNQASDQYSFYDGVNRDYVWDETIAPHADEFVIGAQREIVQDMAVGASFMARFTRNVYDYDEVNLIWAEDGYSIIGTDDGQFRGIYRLRTADIARRDYYQTDVQFKKNYADRWQLLATYSYIVSRGTLQSAVSGSLTNPEQLDYRYGNLWTDMRHQVKAYGSVDLPWDPWTTRVGMGIQYYSGNPYTRYYYSEAYDSYGLLKSNQGTYTRTEGWWTWDIQVSQAIPVRKGELELTAMLENLTNNHQATSTSSGYVSYYNRWVIADRQDPLGVTVGARYHF
ncbi:MAG: carboxypeptidase regulatory-like domain-containing protein [Pseudomonadota bacterium]